MKHSDVVKFPFSRNVHKYQFVVDLFNSLITLFAHFLSILTISQYNIIYMVLRRIYDLDEKQKEISLDKKVRFEPLFE